MDDGILIPRAKITRYLLDSTSEQGASKARFFIEVCGFSPDEPAALAAALRRHPSTAVRMKTRLTAYAPQVDYICGIDTPARGRMCVVTAWKVLKDGTTLQLVTARPAAKSERRGVEVP